MTWMPLLRVFSRISVIHSLELRYRSFKGIGRISPSGDESTQTKSDLKLVVEIPDNDRYLN
jgi:hypothetical protein